MTARQRAAGHYKLLAEAHSPPTANYLQAQGGHQLIQAQVTITLDNSDGRLPVDSATVSVGRTVGLKKDEFFLGGKAAKKGDITAVLEAAGFSRSNPYYVVAQGKVALLADMDDRCVLGCSTPTEVVRLMWSCGMMPRRRRKERTNPHTATPSHHVTSAVAASN